MHVETAICFFGDAIKQGPGNFRVHVLAKNFSSFSAQRAQVQTAEKYTNYTITFLTNGHTFSVMFAVAEEAVHLQLPFESNAFTTTGAFQGGLRDQLHALMIKDIILCASESYPQTSLVYTLVHRCSLISALCPPDHAVLPL